MTRTKGQLDLHDIVLFISHIGGQQTYVGVVVGVGGYDTGYRVRFYNNTRKYFEPSMPIAGSEVEYIGPMPEGVQYDW